MTSGSNHCTNPTQLLTGYRVLDFTAMMAGPYCTRWLADLGAQIIKIEPLDGDHMRTRPPLRDTSSMVFGHLNAGKSSVTLNLKRGEGQQIARELAARCDIVVEAFRPGVMARLGLDAATLTAANPRLIYCSISGFGQAGPMAARPAYAPIVHAASGFELAQYDYQDGIERPLNSGIPLADMLTALHASQAIQLAILRLERCGEGSVIDVSLMASMVGALVFEIQAAQNPLNQRRPLYKPLRAADGFVLVAAVNENNFQNVCIACGHPEWCHDPRLSNAALRFDNWNYYLERIETWTIQRSAEECERILMAAGVPCTRYRRIEEVVADQALQSGSVALFGTVRDAMGDYLASMLPFALSGTQPGVVRHVPLLGEHTEQILSSVLGYAAPVLDALSNSGVIRCASPATRSPAQTATDTAHGQAALA